MISNELVKELREKTGISVMECKKALDESRGEITGAMKILDKKFGGMASKKASRKTKEGIVDSYIHSNGKVGVILELYSETDFVAKNPAFRTLAHDISLHIAAMRPEYRERSDVPEEVVANYIKEFEKEAVKLGKSKEVTESIVKGKLDSKLGEISLMSQPFVKDPAKTIQNLIEEAIGKFGENIRVGNFARYEI